MSLEQSGSVRVRSASCPPSWFVLGRVRAHTHTNSLSLSLSLSLTHTHTHTHTIYIYSARMHVYNHRHDWQSGLFSVMNKAMVMPAQLMTCASESCNMIWASLHLIGTCCIGVSMQARDEWFAIDSLVTWISSNLIPVFLVPGRTLSSCAIHGNLEFSGVFVCVFVCVLYERERE